MVCLSVFAQGDPEHPVTDQWLPPFVVVDENDNPVGTIEDGDAVVLFNFRADRMVQISKAFEYEEFNAFDRKRWPKVRRRGFTGFGCGRRISVDPVGGGHTKRSGSHSDKRQMHCSKGNDTIRIQVGAGAFPMRGCAAFRAVPSSVVSFRPFLSTGSMAS
jgi:BPG-independent PGAM N-terminus (iPGM_N)